MQNEDDIAHSYKTWSAIGTYMQAKYDADTNLAKRNAFSWTILRPGSLSDEPGTRKATVGIKRTRSPNAYIFIILYSERADAAYSFASASTRKTAVVIKTTTSKNPCTIPALF